MMSSKLIAPATLDSIKSQKRGMPMTLAMRSAEDLHGQADMMHPSYGTASHQTFTLIMIFGTCALAAIPGGSNTYLPPNKGYDYPTPNQPFNPPTTPSRPTYPGRTPTYPGPNRTPTYPSPGPNRTPTYPTQPVGPTRPSTRPYQPEEHDHVHVPGMPFDFAYSVNDADTANDYSHQAKSDGDVTKGEYRVQLPDGRTQIVRYTADWKTGFHAEVSYEGEARYPEGPSTFGRQGGQGGSNQGYKY